MSLFQRIKSSAKEAGISLTALAEKTGIPSKAMWRWDENKPAVDKVASVAIALGVSIDYLMGLTDIKTPATLSGDGLTDSQLELIQMVHLMTPEEVSVLLAAAKAQAALRKSQDDS